MPVSRKRIVDCASAGEPPKKMLKDIETVKFVIHNFEDKIEEGDSIIESPILKAHGQKWCILICPNLFWEGEERSCCFLKGCDQKAVTATFAFRIKGCEEPMSEPKLFGSDHRNSAARIDIPRDPFEKDGSLVLECDIRIAGGVWYPKELQQQEILLELYQDGCSETFDVAFSVGETTFWVHKCILACRGKKLYEIAKDGCPNDHDGGGDDDVAPIPVPSVGASIFKGVLDFIYTVKTPEIENEETAMEFLVAADRFDCVHLKLYAESVIVDKFLTAENAAALLIFADSYSCALLKETATNLFVSDPDTVKGADSWSKIRESNRLLEELLDIITSSKKRVGENGNGIDRLDVTALREELAEANLQLDGSREVLIDRLTAHRQDQNQNQDEDSEE